MLCILQKKNTAMYVLEEKNLLLSKKPQEKCIWQLKTYIMNVFHL